MNNSISATIRPRLIDRVGATLERKLHAILTHFPARPSLLSGGVLILITLYLPLAVDSCGRYGGTGSELLAGKPDTYWSSPLGFGFQLPGRLFYIFLLASASVAIFVALRGALRHRPTPGRIARALLAAAGVVSFIVLVDDSILFGAMISQSLGGAELGLSLLLIAITIFVCILCLRARSVRQSLTPQLIFSLAAVILSTGLTVAAYRSLSGGDAEGIIESPLLFVTILALYLVAPVALWLRHSVWPVAHSAGRSVNGWPAVRRRVAMALAPGIAGQILAVYQALTEAKVWGLVPCLIGVHLITLGYLRLAQESHTAADVHPDSGEIKTAFAA